MYAYEMAKLKAKLYWEGGVMGRKLLGPEDPHFLIFMSCVVPLDTESGMVCRQSNV